MMMESNLLKSKKTYNKIDTDFKVEAVATNLLKYYDQNANIFIKRGGSNERPYLKDIKDISTKYYGFDEETLVIETFRESIYDYLPEGFFHPPSLGDGSRNIEKVVTEIRKQKEVEESARQFFQPFELEFFFTEVAALMKEAELDVKDESNALVDIMAELWPIIKKLDSETAKCFLHLLPFLHHIRGNKEWIERFLSAFMNIPVSIAFTQNIIDTRKEDTQTVLLGSTKLGIDYLLNGQHPDGERNWQMNIGPIPYQYVYNYVPGHPFRSLLQDLYDYLVPVTVGCEENFITEKNDTSFIINKSNNTARLGYSTFI